MAKPAIIAAIAAIALTATAIPTALLWRNDDYSVYKPPESIIWPSKVIPKLISARSIRSEHPNISCITNHYGKSIIWALAVVKTDTNFEDVKDFSPNSQSCLLVEYYKQEYEGDKWWGEFRLIWSVKDSTNNQGLITVTNARTDNGKLKGNSAAYILKKGDNGKWAAVRQQEIQESDKTDGGLSNLIPQASSKLPSSPNTERYWGFKPDLKNICTKDTCKRIKQEKTHNFYSWEFTGNSGETPVSSWTDKAKNWLQQIFAWQGIMNKIKDVKGNWQIKTD